MPYVKYVGLLLVVGFIVFGLYMALFRGIYPSGVLGGTLFEDKFDYTDGIVTSEFAHWNPGNSIAPTSSVWDMDSGSLFDQGGTGWTGVPDSCESAGGGPNSVSTNCTNSNVFRLNTKQAFAGDIKVSLAVRQNTDTHNGGCSASGTCWHGVHVWLRYQSEFNLYYASIQRADGKVVIKRKVPCGSDNSGRYFDLSSYVPHNWQVGTWERYSVSIETNDNGSVTIKLYDDDVDPNNPVVTGTDSGGTNPSWSAGCSTPGQYGSAAYTPITAAGAVGVRGDFANFNIDNFAVSELGSLAPPVTPTTPMVPSTTAPTTPSTSTTPTTGSPESTTSPTDTAPSAADPNAAESEKKDTAGEPTKKESASAPSGDKIVPKSELPKANITASKMASLQFWVPVTLGASAVVAAVTFAAIKFGWAEVIMRIVRRL